MPRLKRPRVVSAEGGAALPHWTNRRLAQRTGTLEVFRRSKVSVILLRIPKCVLELWLRCSLRSCACAAVIVEVGRQFNPTVDDLMRRRQRLVRVLKCASAALHCQFSESRRGQLVAVLREE